LGRQQDGVIFDGPAFQICRGDRPADSTASLIRCAPQESVLVKVFGRRPPRAFSPGSAAGVRKPPRDETAGRGTYWAVPRAQLWGFGGGRATA